MSLNQLQKKYLGFEMKDNERLKDYGKTTMLALERSTIINNFSI